MENNSTRIFKPYTDLVMTQKLIQAHDIVLDEFEVKSIVKNDCWLDHQSVYLFVLENEKKELLGGCRMHLYSGREKMPMENIDNYFNQNIYHFFKEGTAEIAGLFLAKEARRRENFNMLFECFINFAIGLGLKELIGIASKQTVKTCLKFGFKWNQSVTQDSVLFYPNKKQHSYFVHCNLHNYLRAKNNNENLNDVSAQNVAGRAFRFYK